MARWTDITAHLADSPRLLGFAEAPERTARALVATAQGQVIPLMLDNRFGDWLHIVTPVTLAAKRLIATYGTSPGMSLTRWDGEWVLHQGIYQPDTNADIVLSAISATANAAHARNGASFWVGLPTALNHQKNRRNQKSI